MILGDSLPDPVDSAREDTMPKTVKVAGGHQYRTKGGKPAGPVRKTRKAAKAARRRGKR